MRAVAPLIAGLVVIVVLARLLGAVCRRLGQPPVIGEIVGGILLGPTLFGGAVTRALFPSDVRPALATLASVGVCVFMFLVGLHLDRSLLRGQGRIASTVSLAAIAVPFGLGALLATGLHADHSTGSELAFVLFVGTAMSATAFPVLARILTDKRLIDTPIGGLALACAAVDDVIAWALLALVAALAGGSAHPWRIVLVVPYAAVLLGVARPALAGVAARCPASGRWTGAAVLVVVAAALYASTELTDWMGLRDIFGAFLLGTAMPRDGATALRERALPWVERGCALLLLPVFFMVAGLKVNLAAIDVTGLRELGLILLVAVGGKVGGAVVGARLSGARWRHSAVLAILINTRGLTELVILTVGMQLAVLDDKLYSLMVVMALVTTAMAGMLLPLVYPQERVRQDMAARHDARARPLPEESPS